MKAFKTTGIALGFGLFIIIISVIVLTLNVYCGSEQIAPFLRISLPALVILALPFYYLARWSSEPRPLLQVFLVSVVGVVGALLVGMGLIKLSGSWYFATFPSIWIARLWTFYITLTFGVIIISRNKERYPKNDRRGNVFLIPMLVAQLSHYIVLAPFSTPPPLLILSPDPEVADLATQEVALFRSGSQIADAHPYPVSAVTLRSYANAAVRVEFFLNTTPQAREAVRKELTLFIPESALIWNESEPTNRGPEGYEYYRCEEVQRDFHYVPLRTEK